MARRIIAVIAVLLIVLTACANSATSGSDDSATAARFIGHATATSDLVLQVGYQGGFTPVEYQLTNLPSFSLYGDGTLLTPGPQIEIYPGPALASIQQQMVTEDGVQAILHAALDAGLDDAKDVTDLGSVGIADAADTVFTIRTDEVERTIHVYALAEVGPDRPPGMDRDEFETRQSLSELAADLTDLASWLPAGSLEEPTAYDTLGARVFVGEHREDEDLPQPVITWPLAPPLGSLDSSDATYGFGCMIATGPDWTDTLLPVAVSANQLSPWRSEGHRYAVIFRPLLPDEIGIADC